jgi:predicted nucleotidyltransferase
MRRAAVVCEFNPFHNGHKFLLEKIKEQYADEIVCIMSGSFVQRGDIAITDKFTRTTAALNSGADLVAGLPTVYAMAPAQIFAENGVRLARELSCGCLCFGAENSIEELYTALDILDSEDTQQRIADNMKAGGYYPRALCEAVGEPYAAIISQPNNILALEYIRACRRYGITPIAIPRVGVNHDSDTVSGSIASATHIRGLILSGADYSRYTPMTVERPASMDRIEAAVLYQLKTMSAAELAAVADVSEGLENRIAEAAAHYNSIQEILEAIKTKRYTMARLRRILLCATLGITREMTKQPVPYLRILGIRAEKKYLIQSETLPLIVDVRRGYDSLDNSAKEIFDVDLRATAMMNIAVGETVNEFSRGLILQ